ncbi:hypothetical protein, conserved [Eimeria maxima]|uniref:LamG-like jellyroll fold domain-containing protein n=1 Tax=Eimeria maxima TaxID=5804 RepID=U6MAK1_EIMMA|nr:hypothetical protein, conserved [Eimeria maxima]CDJ61041.1 hypothetical protein, conserved [Eimeria maxima]
MKFLAPVVLVGCVYTAGTAAEESAQRAATSVEDTVNGVKTTLNFAGKYTNSCFSVPNSLCFGGTEQVVSGNSVPEGLGAWLTFDHLYSADQSGNGNHMHRTPRAGPAHNGRGASAAFVKGASSKIKSSPSLESSDFTVSFWMYLLSDSNGLFRNIVSKGSEMSQTPSILLYPDSRRLSVRVTTDDSGSEGMPSTGSLPLRRWTHVAVTASENRLKLFLNGMKDSEVFLRGNVVPNTEDIVVGASIENPGFEGYIDDFRVYTRGLPEHEVSAMTMPALTGVPDSEFVSLGCDSCGYDFAMNSNMCGEPAAHLCSLQELYQGGIHAARINGLLNSKTEMWHSDMTAGEMAKNESRMALCCAASRGPESA